MLELRWGLWTRHSRTSRLRVFPQRGVGLVMARYGNVQKKSKQWVARTQQVTASFVCAGKITSELMHPSTSRSSTAPSSTCAGDGSTLGTAVATERALGEAGLSLLRALAMVRAR